MKKLLIFLGALAAYGTDCTISDTVRTPFGGYFAGRIIVALNGPGSAQPLYSGSQTLTGWQTTIEVPASANGAVAVTLVCTDTITPAGTSYSARYQPTSGSPWSETWAPTTGTTTIRAMRATTVPTPTTTFQASQIVPGSNGQVLTTTAGASAWGSVPACATCVVTSGSYADPAWITSLAGSKVSGAVASATTATTATSATTATALAANGTNCAAGTFPLGVDASGNSESCTALPTAISGTANQITASASTGAVTLSLPATITGLTSVTSTGFTGALTGNASTATALSTTYTSNALLVGAGTGTPTTGATTTCVTSTGLGVGTCAPAVGLHVINTGAALRLGYDASNYVTFTVGSTGYTNITGLSNQTINFGSGGVLSNTNYPVAIHLATNRNILFGSQSSESSIEAANDALGANVALRLYASKFAFMTGNVLAGTTTDLGYGLHAANKATNGNLLVFDPTATTGTSKAVFVAGQGQSGNILEVRGYNATPGSGTLLASIDSIGRYTIVGGGTSLTLVGNNGYGSPTITTTGGNLAMPLFGFSWAGALDLSLSRASAGVLQVGDGGANANGSIVSASFLGATGAGGTVVIKNTSGNANYAGITAGRGVSADNGGIDFYSPGASTATLRARIAGTTGNVIIGSDVDSNFKLDIASSGSSGTFRVYDQTATTGNTKEVIRAGAGQSTNLTEWQNSAGIAMASVSSAGVGSFLDVKIAAGSQLEFVGRTKLISGGDGLLTIWNNAQTDFARLQFGGTGSSFPALKRSSAILQARLADDSAYTDMQFNAVIVSKAAPAASTDACTAGQLWAGDMGGTKYAFYCVASGTIVRSAFASF